MPQPSPFPTPDGPGRPQPRDRAPADPPRRVLLIDDEATIRAALRRFFTRRGWLCEEAVDGESGLARLLADGDYSLVISDFRMPGLSGAELHDRLALARPELLPRLVLSTGDTVSARASEFFARTRCVVLEKPFSLGALAETADRIAGGG